MPFSNKDNALVKHLYTSSKNMVHGKYITGFSKTNCKQWTGHFAEKDLRNRKHRPKAREEQTETSRARTEENLTTMDEMA